MLFASLFIGSLAYLFFSRRYQSDITLPLASDNEGDSRDLNFKNPYFPKESGFLDHAWRHTQGNNAFDFGYPSIGRQEYANALPYSVMNEFNDSLNETGEGFAIEAGKEDLLTQTGKGAIDVPGQVALIEESFTLEEHPRLDLTRQDVTKGRYRRSEWSFVPGRD